MNSLIPSAPGETGAASALDPAGSLGLGAAKAALGVAIPNARRGPGDAEDDAAAPVPPAPNFAQWLAAGAAGAAAPVRASGFRAPQAKRLPARAEQDTGSAANRPDSAENGASAAPEAPAPLSAAADRPAPARKSALAAASPAVPAGVVAMPPANVPFAPGLPTAGFAPAAPASPSDSLAEHGRQGGGPGRADALAEAGRQDASASAPQAGPKAGAALSPRALTYSGGSRTQLSAPPPGTERPQVPQANLEPPANPAGPDAGPPGAAKSGAFPIAMGSLPASVPVHAGGGEKIAAGIQIQPANGSADQSPRDKNSLSHNDKEDTSQLSGLGMGGAKTVPTMSAPAFAHAHPGEIAPTSGLPMTAGPAAAAAPGAAPSSASATVAREAVEQVLKLADVQASQAEHGVQSVNLGFKFGGSTLGVRVALQGGSVHTQFNTDSPELRSALAAEWRSLPADSAGRNYQFADPVFSSGTGASADLASGSGGGAARREESPLSTFGRPAHPAAAAAAPAASEPAGTGGTALAAGRLNVFA